MILLKYSPIYVPRLSGKLRFQFLFSQLWYPLFALFMGLGFAMPILALARDTNFVAVTYPAFFAHFAPMSIILIVLACQWRSSGSFRPYDAKVLAWEVILFLFARWPWALSTSGSPPRALQTFILCLFASWHPMRSCPGQARWRHCWRMM
jgi:hypothetical protein